MCNAKKLKTPVYDLLGHYRVEVDDEFYEIHQEKDSAFDHHTSPIIRAETPHLLNTNYAWGLIPADWKKEYHEIWNSTYNAKIEFLGTRYAYKDITHQRCLIPATSYFEHHWNDPKGKSKTLYEIVHHDSEIFSLAGLYSRYVNYDGRVLHTYTVLTTEGNDRMKFVHNKDAMKDYFRMPLMLNPEDEKSWLDLRIPYMDFAYPNYQPRLIAEPVEMGGSPPLQLGFDF